MNIQNRESVTPLEFVHSALYNHFGHLCRNIEKLHPDGQYYPYCTEVLTPHCGWVDAEDPNPSFECNKCSENCVEFQKWEAFYSSL